jgi:hypothetical protein
MDGTKMFCIIDQMGLWVFISVHRPFLSVPLIVTCSVKIYFVGTW